MDWVLQHLQLIIGAAGAVAWWLNQRKQAQGSKAVKSPKERTLDDPELAERTRRIREEIQRKIEQRTGRRAQTQTSRTLARVDPATPPPIIREVARRQLDPSPVTVTKAAAARLEAQKTAEILEQQLALSERLRQATELKVAALRRLQFENQLSSGDQAADIARGALADDLRSPDALRRAFILREIIRPPIALRS
jgi:hypothetical protein